MRELEQALSVLQADEIKDILSEYEQHIDMKVKSGLSEEEAIADFGSLSELTADILSAYHVRADYAEEEKEAADKRASEKKAERAERLGSAAESIKSSCGKAGGAAIHGLKGLGIWLWGVILFWKRQLVRPFAWAAKKWKERRAQKAAAAELSAPELPATGAPESGSESTRLPAIRPKRRPKGNGGQLSAGIWKAFRSVGSGIISCIKAAVLMCLWAVRMCWNIGWCLFALVFGGMGLFLLLMFGILVVLLIGGYPLAGVLIACLGMMLCMFSAAWLGITFLWKKKTVPEDSHEKGGTCEEEDVHMKEDGEQYA